MTTIEDLEKEVRLLKYQYNEYSSDINEKLRIQKAQLSSIQMDLWQTREKLKHINVSDIYINDETMIAEIIKKQNKILHDQKRISKRLDQMNNPYRESENEYINDFEQMKEDIQILAESVSNLEFNANMHDEITRGLYDCSTSLSERINHSKVKNMSDEEVVNQLNRWLND